ncbi:hypothetical protein E2C01_045865 [Portunus trituberculatus]|uniref:Uncharacterized protein n=1 Tax=Portunus trituberculatus TaxID=210409 RepID=A0A5B7G2J1_PORTR|nr:hypothetical protein [Portunus trituberculatus]
MKRKREKKKSEKVEGVKCSLCCVPLKEKGIEEKVSRRQPLIGWPPVPPQRPPVAANNATCFPVPLRPPPASHCCSSRLLCVIFRRGGERWAGLRRMERLSSTPTIGGRGRHAGKQPADWSTFSHVLQSVSGSVGDWLRPRRWTR